MERETNPASPSGRSKKRKKKKTYTGLVIVSCLIVVTLALGVFLLYRAEQNRIAAEAAEALRLEQEAVQKKLEEDTARYQYIQTYDIFVDGTTVDGVDVSGLTLMNASSLLRKKVAEQQPVGTIGFSYEGESFTFDCSKIKVRENIADTLKSALAYVRSDDMYKTLQKADEVKENGASFTSEVVWDYSAVDTFVNDVSKALYIQVKNASVTDIDKENHTIATAQAVSGREVDAEALKEAVMNALRTPHTSVLTVPVHAIQPEVSDKAVEMISVVAETSFKGSNDNRIYNIKKGAKLMNGTVLGPNEVFSCNKILGTRTERAGWKLANAYVGGTTDPQAGGGVCQLSSTLYNAAVKADLEIVTRRCHSMPVSYIKKGLDATINSVGNLIDFQFRNNTGSDVVVFAWTEGKNLHFKIYRCPFATDEYDEIKLDAERTKIIEPSGEMEIIEDPTLAPGTEEIDVARQNGSEYKSYKLYYKNGELVKREKLDKSEYKAYNGSKRVGPALPESSSSAHRSDDFIYVPAEESGGSDAPIIIIG